MLNDDGNNTAQANAETSLEVEKNEYDYDITTENNDNGRQDIPLNDDYVSQEEISKTAKELKSKAEEIANRYGGLIGWITIASIIILIQAISTCASGSCSGKNGFAVAAGVIPLVFCGTFLILVRVNKAPAKSRVVLAGFMFIWWTVAVGVLTFETLSTPNYPYNKPSNSYIALWGGFAASVMLVGEEFSQFNQVVSKVRTFSDYHLMVMCASLIVVFSAISPCSNNANGCGGINAYAISVGVVGFVLVIVLAKIKSLLSYKVLRGSLTFQLIWWLTGTIICTFIDPFKEVGNGFIGCWAGVTGSMLLFLACNKNEALGNGEHHMTGEDENNPIAEESTEI